MFGDLLAIRYAEIVDDRHIAIAKPVSIEMMEREKVNPDEAMIGVTESAQSLMDELWAIGIRPSDIGTPGHLAATTKHLEDMRAIAFGKLEIAKP